MSMSLAYLRSWPKWLSIVFGVFGYLFVLTVISQLNHAAFDFGLFNVSAFYTGQSVILDYLLWIMAVCEFVVVAIILQSINLTLQRAKNWRTIILSFLYGFIALMLMVTLVSLQEKITLKTAQAIGINFAQNSNPQQSSPPPTQIISFSDMGLSDPRAWSILIFEFLAVAAILSTINLTLQEERNRRSVILSIFYGFTALVLISVIAILQAKWGAAIGYKILRCYMCEQEIHIKDSAPVNIPTYITAITGLISAITGLCAQITSARKIHAELELQRKQLMIEHERMKLDEKKKSKTKPITQHRLQR